MSDKLQTDADRAKAAAEFDKLMVSEGMAAAPAAPPQPKAKTPAGTAPPADDRDDDSDDEGELDFSDIATELATNPPKNEQAPDVVYKNDAKGKLIAQGYSEDEAHFLAFRGSRKTLERLLENDSEAVSSSTATPADTPTGSVEAGPSLSETLREALEDLDGPAAEELGSVLSQMEAQRSGEVAAMRAELDALRNRSMVADVASTTEELDNARQSLAAEDARLNDRAFWDSLKPHIKTAVTSGLANTTAEAVRLAWYKVSQGQTAHSASNPVDSTPSPSGRAVNKKAGGRAPTAEDRRKMVADAIWNNRSAKDIERIASS